MNAVTEYNQTINYIDEMITKSNLISQRLFWLSERQNKPHEIARNHGLTVDELLALVNEANA